MANNEVTNYRLINNLNVGQIINFKIDCITKDECNIVLSGWYYGNHVVCYAPLSFKHDTKCKKHENISARITTTNKLFDGNTVKIHCVLI